MKKESSEQHQKVLRRLVRLYSPLTGMQLISETKSSNCNKTPSQILEQDNVHDNTFISDTNQSKRKKQLQDMRIKRLNTVYYNTRSNAQNTQQLSHSNLSDDNNTNVSNKCDKKQRKKRISRAYFRHDNIDYIKPKKQELLQTSFTGRFKELVDKSKGIYSKMDEKTKINEKDIIEEDTSSNNNILYKVELLDTQKQSTVPSENIIHKNLPQSHIDMLNMPSLNSPLNIKNSTNHNLQNSSSKPISITVSIAPPNLQQTSKTDTETIAVNSQPTTSVNEENKNKPKKVKAATIFYSNYNEQETDNIRKNTVARSDDRYYIQSNEDNYSQLQYPYYGIVRNTNGLESSNPSGFKQFTNNNRIISGETQKPFLSPTSSENFLSIPSQYPHQSMYNFPNTTSSPVRRASQEIYPQNYPNLYHLQPPTTNMHLTPTYSMVENGFRNLLHCMAQMNALINQAKQTNNFKGLHQNQNVESNQNLPQPVPKVDIRNTPKDKLYKLNEHSITNVEQNKELKRKYSTESRDSSSKRQKMQVESNIHNSDVPKIVQQQVIWNPYQTDRQLKSKSPVFILPRPSNENLQKRNQNLTCTEVSKTDVSNTLFNIDRIISPNNNNIVEDNLELNKKVICLLKKEIDEEKMRINSKEKSLSKHMIKNILSKRKDEQESKQKHSTNVPFNKSENIQIPKDKINILSIETIISSANNNRNNDKTLQFSEEAKKNVILPAKSIHSQKMPKEIDKCKQRGTETSVIKFASSHIKFSELEHNEESKNISSFSSDQQLLSINEDYNTVRQNSHNKKINNQNYKQLYNEKLLPINIDQSGNNSNASLQNNHSLAKNQTNICQQSTNENSYKDYNKVPQHLQNEKIDNQNFQKSYNEKLLQINISQDKFLQHKNILKSPVENPVNVLLNKNKMDISKNYIQPIKPNLSKLSVPQHMPSITPNQTQNTKQFKPNILETKSYNLETFNQFGTQDTYVKNPPFLQTCSLTSYPTNNVNIQSKKQRQNLPQQSCIIRSNHDHEKNKIRNETVTSPSQTNEDQVKQKQVIRNDLTSTEVQKKDFEENKKQKAKEMKEIDEDYFRNEEGAFEILCNEDEYKKSLQMLKESNAQKLYLFYEFVTQVQIKNKLYPISLRTFFYLLREGKLHVYKQMYNMHNKQ